MYVRQTGEQDGRGGGAKARRRKGKSNSRLHVLVVQCGWASVEASEGACERQREREKAATEE